MKKTYNAPKTLVADLCSEDVLAGSIIDIIEEGVDGGEVLAPIRLDETESDDEDLW